MGCYDTINVPCPSCGALYPAQSKGGACTLGEYSMEDASDDALSDVNRHAPFTCDCGVKFEADIATLAGTRVDVSATPSEDKASQMLKSVNDKIALRYPGAVPFDPRGTYFPALMEMLAEEITRLDARIDSLNRRFRRNRGY